MHILITGGSGFLGSRLARTLLRQGSLRVAGQPARTIERITLADRAAPSADLLADNRVSLVEGDLHQQLTSGTLPLSGIDVVFHLAAAVSGECERDLDLGLSSNLETTLGLLQAIRKQESKPVLVYASSIAVFGNTAEQPLPEVISDNTLPTPQNSYGIQKFVGEQLVADFTRRGLVQGRNVRLMTVSVRPGQPNGAASSFLSGMIREPLAGQRAICPVSADTPVALASPANTIAGLIRAAEASPSEWGARTAVNLPALTTTVREMAAALERVAGPKTASLIDWQADPSIAAIVGSWPSRIDARRAAALGLHADANFDSIIQAYIQEHPEAVKHTAA